MEISILALVDQYLGYISEAQRLKIEIAADYLVMAAWLTFLKSRMLLPREKDNSDEPSADEMAQRLAFRLLVFQPQTQRLELFRDVGFELAGLEWGGFRGGLVAGLRLDCVAELLRIDGRQRQQPRAGDERRYATAPPIPPADESQAHERLERNP